MPIYSFTCINDKCQYSLDELRRVADADNETFCPVCGFQMEHRQEQVSPFRWGVSGGWS